MKKYTKNTYNKTICLKNKILRRYKYEVNTYLTDRFETVEALAVIDILRKQVLLLM